MTLAVLEACGGSSGSAPATPPPPVPAAPSWDLVVNTADAANMLKPALIGYYDLSGVLYDFQNVPGLMGNMQNVGFSSTLTGTDWRIGVGRWEIATQILPILTDSSPCLNATPESVSTFATDIELLASRDWFTFTDGSPVLEANIVDARYQLDYVRSVIDDATTFGATPFLSIDHMPRALSINQTPNRLTCDATFTNSVSNNEPVDPRVFSKAVAGLVSRVVEGTGTKTGDDRPRPVKYWEVWNEPEISTFWEPTLTADPDSFFDMAIATLLELDNYRIATADLNGQAIKIGLGSFISETTAIGTIVNFDTVSIPLDFISFHAYNDDPLVIADAIKLAESAIQGSTNYQDIEMALAEWGPDLATRAGDQQYASSMAPALHASTVIALGASTGLDRSHNAIIYDFFPAIALGLIDNGGTPRPLYRAYELMAKLVSDTAERIAVQGTADGRLDAGMGAVLVSHETTNGAVKVLLVNRNQTSRTTRITLDGAVVTPTQLFIFDASANPVDPLTTVAMPQSVFELPPESIAVAEF
ncbi:MAG: hypothetical protein DRR42_01770 [Gammaproteobacteria bacterium]|nr:MAG: hypothetical protein DRR42_01770 [Gammaproteobacteria bacterium]